MAAALLVAALSSGCDVVSNGTEGVPDPLTPDASKAQVVDAAREIVQTLNLDATKVVFWRSSCNDQHDVPFRGVVRIQYPLAESFEASDAEIAGMIERLQSTGWTTDTDFKSHGSTLAKNKVVADFSPQNKSTPNRSIELFGECRDVTTSKETAGATEPITLD